jgi:xanthine dehydrogenase small subunit
MVQFILNKKVIKTEVNPGMTLMDFIRQHEQLKGTKIGCREGDCGACTVLVGELIDGNVYYKSITSCISPLGNANGKHIVTVEGVNLQKELNSTQQAITNNYATQCGFCTPGFVISLTGYALQKASNTINASLDAISGNICRCTGYKSIEKAAKEIDLKLSNINVNKRLDWLIEEKFIPYYFEYIPNKLQELQITVHNNEGAIVAGGTDLYVRNIDKLIEEKVHLINDDEALKGIHFIGKSCVIGANTTVSELLQNKRLRALFPNLKSYIKLISSEQIRNMGTLGGNFVNASPIGDLSIFFLGLNSILTLKRRNGTLREIPFEKFHKTYKKYDLRSVELIKSISFDIPDCNSYFNFEKVSKRTHLDIASVNTSCNIILENKLISEAYIAIGGVAAIPKFLSKTSDFLIGKTINTNNIRQAVEVLQSEIAPIDDIRGTSNYKRLLAQQLFYAHFLKLFPDKVAFQNLVD